MPRRGVRLILLCEDDEHRRFAHRVFLGLGVRRHELRFFVSPTGRGAADRWVRQRYPEEVRAHRRRASSQSVGLLVVIDADQQTVEHRHRQLSNELTEAHLPVRSSNERIVIWVPKRHIETWIAYLSDQVSQAVNERDDYKKRVRDANYRPPAERFIQLYRDTENRPSTLLPSLFHAFVELNCMKL